MNYPWHRTVFPIALIFAFRLLGLFMLIPVFTLYASGLKGATPFLMGVALGCYGLSQGILQIPFGLLSDKIGRKTMITIGLIAFAVGSLWGALTHSMMGMIIARSIQGAGAIGSVLMALLSDLTTDESRTKAMAVIGISIGISFSLAMVMSPFIALHAGLPGIFYTTLVLALIALMLLHTLIPTPQKDPFDERYIHILAFIPTLKNPRLMPLNVGIFCQHFILTSTFYVLPLLLKQHGHAAWSFYLPLMITAFIVMMPLIMVGERRQKMKLLFLSTVSLLFLTQLTLLITHTVWPMLYVSMLLYFIAFNLLEAMLPAFVSRQAEVGRKGVAMGIYSSSQFLGIFFGGLLAGVAFQFGKESALFGMNTLLSLLWFWLATSMNPQDYLLTQVLSFNGVSDVNELLKSLQSLPGVHSASFSAKKKQIFLRVNKAQYIEGTAQAVIDQKERTSV